MGITDGILGQVILDKYKWGKISLKDTQGYFKDMHTVAKREFGQVIVLKREIKEVTRIAKELKEGKVKSLEQEKRRLKGVLDDVSGKIKKIDAECANIIGWGSIAYFKLHEKLESMIVENEELMLKKEIPASIKEKIKERVQKAEIEETKDVSKDLRAITSVERGAASSVLYVFSTERGLPKRIKRRAWRAIVEEDKIERLDLKFNEDKAKHLIEEMEKDEIKMIKDYEYVLGKTKQILIYTSILMKDMHEHIEAMEKATKKAVDDEAVRGIFGDLAQSWKKTVGREVLVLRRLRWSGLGEHAKAA